MCSKDRKSMKKDNKISPVFLGFTIVLMGALVWVCFGVFNLDDQFNSSVVKQDDYLGLNPELKAQSAMYYGLKDDASYPHATDKETSKRTIAKFQNIRAYHGAPPRIPHKVTSSMKGAFENCLQCHANGGYAKEFKAYAPVTPHPEMINCKQCHVPKRTNELFKPTHWKKDRTVAMGKAHLPGSPPTIPHGLQMRENCLSCHSGQGSLKDIRVTHPERVNCRQCHVPAIKDDVFVRGQK